MICLPRSTSMYAMTARVQAAATAATWSDWLTLSDLDSGGTVDSDPNGIVTSLTEPSAGVLLFSIAPDGTARDGYAEGGRWDITPASGGWFDSDDWAGDGTQIVVFQIELNTAPSDISAIPCIGIGILTATDGGAATMRFPGAPTDTIIAATTSTTNTSIATGSSTTSGKHIVSHVIFTIGDAGDTTGNTDMMTYCYAIDANGDTLTANNIIQDLATITKAEAHDPTTWTVFLWAGYDAADATAFTVRCKFRYAILSKPALA